MFIYVFYIFIYVMFYEKVFLYIDCTYTFFLYISFCKYFFNFFILYILLFFKKISMRKIVEKF